MNAVVMHTRKSVKPKGKKVSHMRIEPMDDGSFTSETHFKPSKEEMKNGMSYMHDEMNTHKATHANASQLAKHVKSVFAPATPAGAPGAPDPATNPGGQMGPSDTAGMGEENMD